MQDRALLEQSDALVLADAGWGRPPFEWAYEMMEATYRDKTGEAGRLLWAWTDPWLARTARDPSHARVEARSTLAGLARAPSQRLVLARLPRSSVTMSAHFLWDGFVLRGRYVPRSIEDAAGFHDRHGTPHLEGGDGRDQRPCLVEEILASWRDAVFSATYTGTELRLQATVTRIEQSSIIAELDPMTIDPFWSSANPAAG